jgi:hypothetical protein
MKKVGSAAHRIRRRLYDVDTSNFLTRAPLIRLSTAIKKKAKNKFDAADISFFVHCTNKIEIALAKTHTFPRYTYYSV